MATWHYPGGKASTAFNDDTTSSGWQPQNFCYGGSAITLPAGTVTQLGAFTDSSNTASLVLKLGLYDSSGNLIVQGSTTLPTSAAKAWNTVDVIDTPISAGTYYVLGSGSTNQLRYGYDTTGTGRFASVNHAAAMASPVSFGDEPGTDYGTRAEVEESGGEPQQYDLEADAGSYSVAGDSIELTSARLLTAQAAAVAVTGHPVDLSVERPLSAGGASYAVTGHPTALRASRLLSAEAGHAETTGSEMALQISRLLALSDAAYAVTGQAIGLKTGRPFSMEAGSVTWAGNALTMRRAYRLTLEPSDYVVGGQAIFPHKTSRLAAASAAYSWDGHAAALTKGRYLEAEVGAYIWMGQPVTLRVARRLDAGSAAYAWTGASINLGASTGTAIHNIIARDVPMASRVSGQVSVAPVIHKTFTIYTQ